MTTATEEAPVETPMEAIPLNSLQALAAWREHKEAALRAPLSPTAQAAVEMCHAANMRDREAEYLMPLPVAEPLPKRERGASVAQPYTPGLLVTGQSPSPLPERDPFTAEAGPPAPESPAQGFMPGSEEALANVEKRAGEAEDAHEAASRADLERWTGGETLGDEGPQNEALENLLDIHDTDPAGETVDETAVITGLEGDEPPA